MYEKPIPLVDPDTEPYWNALKNHLLILRSCLNCKKPHFYPRSICPYCHSDDLNWVTSEGKGVIYSYTIARRPAGPSFKADVPYAVGIVQLSEGPRLLTNIISTNPEEIRIGAQVHVVYDDVSLELTLPKFSLS